jgi:hypothetical protein
MTVRRGRLAALMAGVVSLLVMSGGVANAAPGAGPRHSYVGPFSTQASCASASEANNDPPEVVDSHCVYYTPTGPSGYGPPGWYYGRTVSIG